MALNFLDPQYKQTSISRIFGICDDQNKTPAYIDESDPSTWAAEVVNEDLKLVSFYPIDYCVDTLRAHFPTNFKQIIRLDKFCCHISLNNLLIYPGRNPFGFRPGKNIVRFLHSLRPVEMTL